MVFPDRKKRRYLLPSTLVLLATEQPLAVLRRRSLEARPCGPVGVKTPRLVVSIVLQMLLRVTLVAGWAERSCGRQSSGNAVVSQMVVGALLGWILTIRSMRCASKAWA